MCDVSVQVKDDNGNVLYEKYEDGTESWYGYGYKKVVFKRHRDSFGILSITHYNHNGDLIGYDLFNT